jgi:response regulator RpfG family c-di-GMP phosphodiesterase
LRKPIPYDQLRQTIQAAADQYRLITAERTLLERTLKGSIQTLTDLFAAVCPQAFGRANRIKARMSDLLERLDIQDRWHIELAAMMCQIGIVTIPPALVEKSYHGQILSRKDQDMLEKLPEISAQLLAGIPRLEQVREIILHQNYRFAGGDGVRGGPGGEALPLGSRALKILLDRDILESQGLGSDEINKVLRGRSGWYDPEILEAVIGNQETQAEGQEIRELSIADLREGMVFADDVETTTGVKMIARGQEASESLLLRLRNSTLRLEFKLPIRVMVPLGSPAGKTELEPSEQ